MTDAPFLLIKELRKQIEKQALALREAREIIASIDEDADVPWLSKWESLWEEK